MNTLTTYYRITIQTCISQGSLPFAFNFPCVRHEDCCILIVSKEMLKIIYIIGINKNTIENLLLIATPRKQCF